MRRFGIKTIVILALILCVSYAAVGCGDKEQTAAVINENIEGGVIGEGNTQFVLTVIDDKGVATEFTINTDKTTVGDALLDNNIIQGEMGDYGLYVKTVNGVTADYDTDGTYWAFYIDGEYATTGVDTTDIVPGTQYTLAVEK